MIEELSQTGIDIVGHMRNGDEEALREAERKYRDIFENAGEGIFQTTPDGRFITANPALARMLGFDSADELILSRTNIERQHYVDPRKREEFKRLLEEHGIVRGFEYQGYRKDGRTIWLSDSVRAVRDQSGTLLFYEGIVEDITERKRAEIRGAAFATLARKLSGATTPFDAARTIVETADELFGWDSCRLGLYDGDQDLIHSILNLDTIDGRRVDVTPFISGEKPSARSRRVIDKGAWLTLREEPCKFDEESVPFGDVTRPSAAIMDVPIRHASEIIGILSIHSYRPQSYDHEALNNLQSLADHCGEAFNRIRTEEALRESEERYRELFENAKDAMYVHDLNGRYTSVNSAAEKLSGYTRDEILGKHFAGFVAPEHLEDVRQNLCRKLSEEGETTYEVEVISKDCRRVPVEISSRLIYENGVPVGIQGTARDITERRQSQQALQTFSRRLMDAQEAERQRIALELHDEIGQVLTAVKLNLQAVQSSCETAACAPLIEDNIAVVNQALVQVRDLSLDLRPSLLDDLGLAAALRWYINRQAQLTGVRAEVLIELPDHNVRFARGLETACFRIAQEALTNVARHAHAKRVLVQLQRDEDDLLLTIKDDGVGFDVDALQKRAPGGATLGLQGMQERAHAVNGTIVIDSASSKGTEIRSRFPIKAGG